MWTSGENSWKSLMCKKDCYCLALLFPATVKWFRDTWPAERAYWFASPNHWQGNWPGDQLRWLDVSFTFNHESCNIKSNSKVKNLATHIISILAGEPGFSQGIFNAHSKAPAPMQSTTVLLTANWIISCSGFSPRKSSFRALKNCPLQSGPPDSNVWVQGPPIRGMVGCLCAQYCPGGQTVCLPIPDLWTSTHVCSQPPSLQRLI